MRSWVVRESFFRERASERVRGFRRKKMSEHYQGRVFGGVDGCEIGFISC